MYKTMHKLGPEYLQRLFTKSHAEAKRSRGQTCSVKAACELSETKFLLWWGLFMEQFVPRIKGS